MLLSLLFLALSATAQERSIYVERATIWSSMDVGYTYVHCRDNPGSEVCKRRKAWPEGGELVNQREPYNQRTVIIQIGEKVGWIDIANVDINGKRVFRPSRVYENEDLSGASFEVKKGDPIIYAPRSINKNDDTYYFVDYRKWNKDTEKYELRSGWIAGSTLTKKEDIEESTAQSNQAPLPRPAKPTDDNVVYPAPASGRGYSPGPGEAVPPICEGCLRGKMGKAEDEFSDVQNGIVTGPQYLKFGRDLEKFACIHSSNKLYKGNFTQEKFCAVYANAGEKNFRGQIRKASEKFQIPESLIGCTLMVESGLAFPEKCVEYCGYGQIGRAAVEDLNRQMDLYPDLKNMWQAYAPSRPSHHFNNQFIRKIPDVEMQVGAVALYLRWMLTKQIPGSGCRDCSQNPSQPNRKDIYLAVAGYNWSPYGIGRIASFPAEQLKNKVPEETRGYFGLMDRCMKAGNYGSYKNPFDDAALNRSRGAKCEKSCP